MGRPAKTREQSRDELKQSSIDIGLRTDFSYLKEVYPDKVFRLVNDEKGRVATYQRQGWEPVEDKEEDNVLGSFLDAQEGRDEIKKPSTGRGKKTYIYTHVGQINTTSDGRAVLMMIDKSRFEVIQSARLQRVRQSEAALDPEKIEGDGVQTYAPNLPNGKKGLTIT